MRKKILLILSILILLFILGIVGILVYEKWERAKEEKKRVIKTEWELKIDSLKNELKLCSQRDSTFQVIIDSLERRTKEYEAQKAVLETELKGKEALLSAKTESIAMLRSQIDQMQKEGKDANALQSKLQNELTDLSGLQGEVDSMQQRDIELRAELARTRTEKERLENEVSRLISNNTVRKKTNVGLTNLKFYKPGKDKPLDKISVPKKDQSLKLRFDIQFFNNTVNLDGESFGIELHDHDMDIEVPIGLVSDLTKLGENTLHVIRVERAGQKYTVTFDIEQQYYAENYSIRIYYLPDPNDLENVDLIESYIIVSGREVKLY